MKVLIIMKLPNRREQVQLVVLNTHPAKCQKNQAEQEENPLVAHHLIFVGGVGAVVRAVAFDFNLLPQIVKLRIGFFGLCRFVTVKNAE